MKNYLVGFFQVEGHGADCVETPLIGSSTEEHAKLNSLIRRKHPKSKSITRTGTSIESRDDESSAIQLTPGQTLAGLFGATDTLRVVGQVWFKGAPYGIVLAYYRAQGCVSLILRARLAQDGDIRFPNRVSPSRLASELPKVVEEILGREARDIKLTIREAK